MTEERLQKILARAGLGSRRSCETLITEGRVKVNGRRAILGQKADAERDQIAVDGRRLTVAEPRVYVALNKPRWVVSSLSPQGERRTVRDLVPVPERIYPVGRLDLESEGLVLLTNDGALTEKLTHPRYEHEKEYRVLVDGLPAERTLSAWRSGVMLEGQRTTPAQVRVEAREGDGVWLDVIMREGRKHQIRDVAALLGLSVRRLIRVRLGTLKLGSLPPGKWRYLAASEIAALKRLTGLAPIRARGAPRKLTP